MKITCSSTYTALISAKSSDCFNSILKKINSNINWEYALSVFNKIKTLIPISQEEENFISWLINSSEFDLVFDEFLKTLDIPEKNKNILTKKSFLVSFDILTLKSRVIDILNHIWNEKYFSCEWKTYLKIDNKWEKNIYLELIEKYEDYWVFIDIKSWKFKLLNLDNNEIVLESKTEIFFNRNKLTSDWMLISTWIECKNDYLLYNNQIVSFSKKSEVIENNYSIFFIDFSTSQIIQLDKDTSKITYKDFSPNEFLQINKNYLLEFLPSVFIWNKLDNNTDSSYSNWSLQLYDIFKNKLLLHDIHEWTYYFKWDLFIYLSTDLKYLNYFNLTTKQNTSQLFSEVLWFNNSLSSFQNFKNLQKNETN